MMSSQDCILISACLLGERVRFDGRVWKRLGAEIRLWRFQKRLIAICPEVSGGLSVPRSPAEIENGIGCDVLCGKTGVIDAEGRKVTTVFLEGAHKALELARNGRAHVAVMKDGSPSCGVTYIYDGSFSRKRIAGCGVTTALLKTNGIKVFTERDLEKVDTYFSRNCS